MTLNHSQMLKRVREGAVARRVGAPEFESICVTKGELTLHNLDNQTSTVWTPKNEEIEYNRYVIIYAPVSRPNKL